MLLATEFNMEDALAVAKEEGEAKRKLGLAMRINPSWYHSF